MVIGYFGLPGSGKTTFLTRIAQKELRRIKKGKSKYSHVLTNFFCRDCEKIDYKDLGHFEIENSLILLDEITLDADSRNFKQFDEWHKSFFLLHRHYNCDVIYFTQQYDGVDKKIRDITSSLFFVKKVFVWSIATRIYRTLDIVEITKEIVQGYRFPNWFENLFARGVKQICFRPKWYKYFDSWEKPPERSKYIYQRWLHDIPVSAIETENNTEQNRRVQSIKNFGSLGSASVEDRKD